MLGLITDVKEAVEEVSLIGGLVKLTVDDNRLTLDAESSVSWLR